MIVKDSATYTRVAVKLFKGPVQVLAISGVSFIVGSWQIYAYWQEEWGIQSTKLVTYMWVIQWTGHIFPEMCCLLSPQDTWSFPGFSTSSTFLMEPEDLPLLWGEVIVFAKSEQQQYGSVNPLLLSGDAQGWSTAKDTKLLVSSTPGQMCFGGDWCQMDVHSYIKWNNVFEIKNYYCSMTQWHSLK